jgi:hypothetical protein
LHSFCFVRSCREVKATVPPSVVLYCTVHTCILESRVGELRVRGPFFWHFNARFHHIELPNPTPDRDSTPVADRAACLDMSFPNIYAHRKVADTKAKSCDICFKISSSVLITPDNKVRSAVPPNRHASRASRHGRNLTINRTGFMSAPHTLRTPASARPKSTRRPLTPARSAS